MQSLKTLNDMLGSDDGTPVGMSMDDQTLHIDGRALTAALTTEANLYPEGEYNALADGQAAEFFTTRIKQGMQAAAASDNTITDIRITGFGRADSKFRKSDVAEHNDNEMRNQFDRTIVGLFISDGCEDFDVTFAGPEEEMDRFVSMMSDHQGTQPAKFIETLKAAVKTDIRFLKADKSLTPTGSAFRSP